MPLISHANANYTKVSKSDFEAFVSTGVKYKKEIFFYILKAISVSIFTFSIDQRFL